LFAAPNNNVRGAFKRCRGMTLVELLVAICILGIITAMGVTGLDSIVHARRTLTDDMEEFHGIQLAFAQMQNDCSQLPGADEVQGRRLLQIEPDRIVLLRRNAAAEDGARFAVVIYRLQGENLTRLELPATRELASIDGAWQAALDNRAAGKAVTLQQGVRELRTRAWQPSGWQPGTEGMRSLPRALEISIRTSGHQAGLVKVFLLDAT